MNAFIMNCSPVRNGATAEIVNIVSSCLREKYEVEIACLGSMGLCSIEYKEDVEARKPEIIEFCSKI